MDICGEKRNIRLAYIEGTRAVVLDSTEQVVQGIIWLDKKLPFYKFVALHCIWIVLHVMLSFFILWESVACWHAKNSQFAGKALH
jgi:hypothetical protein